MSKLSGVPHMDQRVDLESYRDGLLNILKVLRSNWNQDDIVLKPVGPNLVNLAIRCSHGKDENDAIIARINGNVIKMMPAHFDRDYEYKVISLLRTLSLGAPVIMTFTNGFCMKYIQGQQYTWDDSFYEGRQDQDDFIRIIINEIASYHCKRTADLASEMGFETTSYFKKLCHNVLDHVPHVVIDALPGANRIRELFGPHPHDIMETEFNHVFNTLDTLDLPVTFCHTDANPTNFIYRPEDQRAVLVDCESCCFNYPIYDIANHLFLSFVGLHPDIDKKFPNDAFITKWLHIYFEERCSLGDEFVDIEAEVGKWMDHFKNMMLGVYLWQSALALYWIQQKDDFDQQTLDYFLEIAVTRMTKYFKEKGKT